MNLVTLTSRALLYFYQYFIVKKKEKEKTNLTLNQKQDTKTRSLPSYNNIADGAQTIMDGCYKEGETMRGFGGSLNHPDKWRVIVDGYKYRINQDWQMRYDC